MRTTTLVWSFDPGNPITTTTGPLSNSVKLKNAAAELAGNLYTEPLSISKNEEGTLLTVKRGWPDLATAQAWVDLCLQESQNTPDSNLVSAQVDPE